MGVYIYDNNTEKELKNGYIGEYGWHPGANTLAYYKFDGNLNDETGNTTATALGTISYASVGDGQSISKTTTNGVVTTLSESVFGNAFTISIRVYFSSTKSLMRLAGGWGGTSILGSEVDYANIQYESGSGGLQFYNYNGQRTSWTRTPSTNTWYNIIITGGGVADDLEAYINGQALTNIRASYDYTSRAECYVSFGTCGNQDGLSAGQSYAGYLDSCIIEDKKRNAQEVTTYFNQAKLNYGIS